MIVLDTNVISELMAAKPFQAVLEWISLIPPHSVFTTTITQAEILYGIRILPDGKRKAGLDAAAQRIFSDKLAGRVLPFDISPADIYPVLAAKRRQMGLPIGQFDAQIAAICLSRGASLATRNVADFTGIGLDIINPWDFSG
jgi:predicted nucleic acid-binding protein